MIGQTWPRPAGDGKSSKGGPKPYGTRLYAWDPAMDDREDERPGEEDGRGLQYLPATSDRDVYDETPQGPFRNVRVMLLLLCRCSTSGAA
jgi:hypothetical protein